MAAGLARAGWRGPMGGGAGRAGRPGLWGLARRRRWSGRAAGGCGVSPAPPLASAGEPPRSDRGGTSAAAGSSALCGRGQMSEYGGGSERPRNPQPPPAAPQPSPPRPDARSPTRGGWKLERKPESCPLRTPGVPPSSGPGGVALMVGGGDHSPAPRGLEPDREKVCPDRGWLASFVAGSGRRKARERAPPSLAAATVQRQRKKC